MNERHLPVRLVLLVGRRVGVLAGNPRAVLVVFLVLASLALGCGRIPGDGVHGPPLRYRDNGDGTITDLESGLMWEQKVEGASGAIACLTALHSVDARCTIEQAMGAWIDAVNTEGGTGYAGYDDWRVPNAKELQSIVDYSRCFPNPNIDNACVDRAAIHPVFGPASPTLHWTSTPYLLNPSKGWGIGFIAGGVTVAPRNVARRVRAVRNVHPLALLLRRWF